MQEHTCSQCRRPFQYTAPIPAPAANPVLTTQFFIPNAEGNRVKIDGTLNSVCAAAAPPYFKYYQF